MKIFGTKIPMMFSLLIWVVLWEIVGRLEMFLVIPPFSAILVAVVAMAQAEHFHDAALLSLYSFAMGMLLSVAVGIPLGLVMGKIPAADRLLGMWVNVFLSAPLSALVPIIMILFGFGQTTIIVTVFMFAVWIITLDTCAGVKHINPSLLEMGESFGASLWQMYSKILIWAVMPEILAGLRLGLIRAVKGVIIGQLLVALIGMGELLTTYSRGFHMEEFWALIFFLFAFALGSSWLISLVERRIEYYAGSRS